MSSREDEDCRDDAWPVCDCEAKTVKFVVQRENENWGRGFLRCRNYKSKPNCYFQWLDEGFSERVNELIREGRAKEKMLEAKIMKMKLQMKKMLDFEMDTINQKVIEKEELVRVQRDVDKLRRYVWVVVVVLVVGVLIGSGDSNCGVRVVRDLWSCECCL